MRSNGLRYTVIGLVLVVLSALGGFVIADALDDDGTSTAETDGSSTTTAPTTTPSGEQPTGTQPPDGQTIVATRLGLLGWWDGKRWVGNDGPAAPLVAGLAFTYLPLEGESASAVGGGPTTSCGISEDLPHVELDPGYGDGRQVAVSGVANPLPRRVQPLDRTSATYRAAATEALATVGIDDDAPEVTQLLRVDLDGDGNDEVLLTAERRSHEDLISAKPGDYSAVIVRRVEGAGVRAQVLLHSQAEAPDGGDGLAFRLDHRIVAVADLDGNATLEVVVSADHYEGASFVAFEIGANGKLAEILSVGCGA